MRIKMHLWMIHFIHYGDAGGSVLVPRQNVIQHKSHFEDSRASQYDDDSFWQLQENVL